MAEIVARDARKTKDIWINFFLCRMSQQRSYDDDDNQLHDDKVTSTETQLVGSSG